MNVFGKFDEIPSLILQDIKETKRLDTLSFGWTDNVKTVYPPIKHCLWGGWGGGGGGGIINAIRHAYEVILRTSLLNA